MSGVLKVNEIESLFATAPASAHNYQYLTADHSWIEHGILQENCDYHCHICFMEGTAYVYPTEMGKKAVRQGKGYEHEAGQPGVEFKTGKGRIINPMDIDYCERYVIPKDLLHANALRPEYTTSQKGACAVRIVAGLLKRKLIKIPLQSVEITDADLQIKGVDMLICCKINLQVKCDKPGGMTPYKYRDPAGIFLQTHERNPLKRR